MGCQKAIAAQIIDQEANYVLALKKNHLAVYDDVVTLFDQGETDGYQGFNVDMYVEGPEKGHGRIDKRRCVATSDIEWLDPLKEWPALKSVCMVERTTTQAGKQSTERRYFLSSLPAHASDLLHAVRSHWAIENNVHWTLDVVFREDESRIRSKNGAQNMAIIRRIALNALKREKEKYKNVRGKKDMSLVSLMGMASWGTSTLRRILHDNFF